VLRKKTAPIEGQTTEITEVNQNRSLTTLIFIVIVGVGTALAYAMQMVGADLAAVGIGQERANGQKEAELKRET
jgi:hypothetical protein